MPSAEPLVSIGLPVRNGADTLANTVASILAQDHARLEVVISDNASTDGTEEVCRELARGDERIAYHRQSENIGLLPNFVATIRLARGEYFRWLGDDDWLAPDAISRSVQAFAADERLVLVTSSVEYIGADGSTSSGAYEGSALGDADPVVRFQEWLHLLNESHLLLDPLYGMVRRAPVAPFARRPMLGEDEVFAARLSLLGPWAHLPQVLVRRHRGDERAADIGRRLGLPGWHPRVALALQSRELLRLVREAGLTPAQRRRADAAVAGWYVRRQGRTAVRRTRKLARLVLKSSS
jgi:glycosyltransferase involved in cell wall biosynthesis